MPDKHKWVLWFQSPQQKKAATPPQLPSVNIEVSEVLPHNQEGIRLYILDGRGVKTPAELLQRGSVLERPILYMVSSSWASEILAGIREGDEVSLLQIPPALLAHRIHIMLRQMTPLNDPKQRIGLGRDGLTGLDNRQTFVAKVEQKITTLHPAQEISLLIVDLDHFKAFNDHYGHLMGDRLLQHTAKRLRQALPNHAMAGRLGGEEFGIALRISQSQAHALGETICREFAVAPIRISAQEGGQKDAGSEQAIQSQQTVSIGVSTLAASHASPRKLLGLADKALYAAKVQGRNRAVHVLKLEQEAIDKNSSLSLENFENMTRVLAERVADTIVRRGRQMLEELKEQAEIDALTGLRNRRYFDQRYYLEYEMAHEHKSPLSVALLDVDFFGKVNKTYGWPTGDKVLSELSHRLKDNLRHTDWLARYGGEEICIVMPQTSLEQAVEVAERLRQTIDGEDFTTTAGEALHVTASLGVAQQKIHQPPPALLERVSQALLTAKKQGRNQVQPG